VGWRIRVEEVCLGKMGLSVPTKGERRVGNQGPKEV